MHRVIQNPSEEKTQHTNGSPMCTFRINPQRLDVPSGVVVYGYVPNVIDYFAACDVVVLQPGLSSTMEIIALQKPFIYFPIPQHFEQYEFAKKEVGEKGYWCGYVVRISSHLIVS